MTSGVFTSIFLPDIIINRTERQRRELLDIEELADSLSRLGLIHPIVITRDNVLVAGERRLTAARSLGWTHISAQYTDELPPEELHLIELEENTRRNELPWKDRCEAIAKYHELRKSLDPEWDTVKTAEALNTQVNVVRSDLAIHKELQKGNPLVVNAESLSIARNATRRAKAREQSAVLGGILGEPSDEVPLQNIDFVSWLDTYKGPPFNFIHCDFPYGINFDKSPAMGKVNSDRYPDSFETYAALIEAFARVPVTDSAHLMFWYSPVHGPYTQLALMKQGWVVQPRPLIWGKSDNSGILADSRRGPRYNYETAFMASRGDRFVAQSVGNIYWGPRSEGHPSAKPYDMLRHFFRMFVDGTTHMLDPTCGGATAVRAAQDAGAARVLGLEINEEFYKDAVREWV